MKAIHKFFCFIVAINLLVCFTTIFSLTVHLGMPAEEIYVVARKAGLVKEALAAYDLIYNNQDIYGAWLDTENNRAELYYHRGEVLYALGHDQETLKAYDLIYDHQDEYQGWLDTENHRAELYYRRGEVLLSMGNRDALYMFESIYEHQDVYRAWLDAGTNRADLFYNRGYVLPMFGRYREALDTFNLIYEHQDVYREWLAVRFNRDGLIRDRELVLQRIQQPIAARQPSPQPNGFTPLSSLWSISYGSIKIELPVPDIGRSK